MTNLYVICTRIHMCKLMYLSMVYAPSGILSDVQVCHQNPMGSHCTMGQVGLSMGVHCPTSGTPYPTVCPIPLYHGIGGTVHGSPLSHLRDPISHCPSYPTVPWDRWDCPWESTVPPEGPHIPLSVLSHCTMGQVGLSMGVHCPT